MYDPTYRKTLAASSLYWFAHIYFSRYIHYETADFQRAIYRALESSEPFLEILAFRGSTKSTIATLIYPIWAIIGKQRKRYPVIIGDTFPQARQYLYNTRNELETNELLIADFGPFKAEENDDEWQKTTIVIPKYSARMSAHSSGQNIRGLRHLDRRPDLVICDDLENSESVRKKEQRDKLYNWFKADVMNVGDHGTKFIAIGNLLHSDSFMMRLKKEISEGRQTGRIIEVAIQDKDGNPTWTGKFPDKAALESERRRLNNDRAWIREALLKIVAEDGQPIKDEWIVRCKEMPKEFQPTNRGAGVDLAISKKDTADFTSIVPGIAGLLNGKPKIYISAPINEHFSMHETVERLRLLAVAQTGIRFFVEKVGYQEAAIETMKLAWLNVDPVQPIGDKLARLQTIARYVQDGTIEFLDGCEDLILQMLHFGVEEHDDLVDAFVYLILGLLKSSIAESKVIWL